MNAVLDYAIYHQETAKRVVVGVFRIPPCDAEDVVQDAYMRVLHASRCRTGPVDYPTSYWKRALRTAVAEYWRRRKHTAPLIIDPADYRQDDPETVAIQREAVREALAAAKPSERAAVREYVLGLPKTNASRTAMCRLRRRLQAA
jgi:DNA-directed RNA polymerase specialized sigma24 family protein